jgi:hypothetical protein
LFGLPAHSGQLAVLLATVAFTTTSHAFERQWHVGGGLGAAGISGLPFKPGPAAGLHAAYGISDVFDLHLEGSLSRHEFELDASPELFWTANFGAVYKLDVIEWIPYGGLGFGYHAFLGSLPESVEPSPETAGFDASLVLGVDYALRRNFGLGFQFRQMLYLEDMSAGTFSIGLFRAEYRWGF